MSINNVQLIKQLRDETGISMMQCKKALEEAGGNLERARENLRKQGAAVAAKKEGREIKAGTVASYLHNEGEIGALVVLGCETDFVGRNEEFRSLARDIAMHVAAMNPSDAAELLSEDFVKDPTKTVADVIKEAVQKFGENIKIEKFARFSVAGR